MKKTTNFDAFAQFADAQLSKEEMKNIKGGVGGTLEGGDGGSGSGGGIKGGGEEVGQGCEAVCGTRNAYRGTSGTFYYFNEGILTVYPDQSICREVRNR